MKKLISLIVITFLIPTAFAFADKTIVAKGTLDCGQDQCNIGDSSNSAGFLINSQAGKKILDVYSKNKFKAIEIYCIVDEHGMIKTLNKVSPAK